MLTSVLSALQIATTLGLVAWMINGFTPLPGRWLRWKMFCRAAFTIITLTGTTKDGRTEPVNVYDHLSPGSFILGPPQLQTILDHLTASGRYERIDGHGRVLSAPRRAARGSEGQPCGSLTPSPPASGTPPTPGACSGSELSRKKPRTLLCESPTGMRGASRSTRSQTQSSTRWRGVRRCRPAP